MAHKKTPDFLTQFIGDSARARVVRALVLNEHEVFTPAHMGKRTGISERAAKAALVWLQKIGVARTNRIAKTVTDKKGKRGFHDVWFLDSQFPHVRALAMFVRDISPLNYEEVLHALKKTGRLSIVVLSGTFVGDATRPADIVIAGEGLSERRMESAMRTLESLFGRELRYASFPTAEFRYRLTVQDKLLRDTFDFPHRVLLDRVRA